MEPEDADIMVPVRDMTEKERQTKSMFHEKDGSLVQERAGISKLSREELEDRHLRLLEQNQLLKKHCHKQEDKIKRLATKLLRLVQDRRRGGEPGRQRDPETAELMEAQQEQIRSLRRQLAQTKDKLLVARQQVAGGGVRPGRGLAARQEPVRRLDSRPSSKTSSLRPPPAAGPEPPALPAYAERLLVEARAVAGRLQERIAQLEETLTELRQQRDLYHQELGMLKEQSRAKELEHEEEVEALRNQLNHASRCKLSENVEMIKLQRELRQTAGRGAALQSRCQQLETERRSLQETAQRASQQLAELGRELEAERRRCGQLQQETVAAAQTSQRLEELEACLQQAQKENDLLRATNERLSEIGDSELGRQRQSEAVQSHLRAQLANIDVSLRSEQQRSNQLTQQLNAEQQRSNQLTQQLTTEQQRCNQLTQQLTTEQQRSQRIQVEARQWSEEVRKQHQPEQKPPSKPELKHQAVNTTEEWPDPSPPTSPTTELLQKVTDGQPAARRLAELHCEHVQTIQELEKARTLLDVQRQISAGQQREVTALSLRLAEQGQARDKQEAELRATLDARNARVTALERRLRQVAYGGPEQGGGWGRAALLLDAGSCLLELGVLRLQLTETARAALDPHGVFLSWVFFDQDTQYTPVVRGPPEFACSALYKLPADDRLVHYLQHDRVTIEAHRTDGEEGSQRLGSASISCSELLRYPRNKLHGTVEIAELGTLSYWLRADAALEVLLRTAPAPATANASVTGGSGGADGDHSIVAGSPELCGQPVQPKTGHGPAAVSTPVRRRPAVAPRAAARTSSPPAAQPRRRRQARARPQPETPRRPASPVGGYATYTETSDSPAGGDSPPPPRHPAPPSQPAPSAQTSQRSKLTPSVQQTQRSQPTPSAQKTQRSQPTPSAKTSQRSKLTPSAQTSQRSRAIPRAQTSQHSQPAASPQRVQPAASPQMVQPAASPQRVKPAASPQRVQPAASPQRIQPAASPQRIQPAASPQRVQQAASPQRVQPTASPQRVQPAASPQHTLAAGLESPQSEPSVHHSSRPDSYSESAPATPARPALTVAVQVHSRGPPEAGSSSSSESTGSGSSADSEGVVVHCGPAPQTAEADTITVEVHSVTLWEAAAPYSDGGGRPRLFVEYRLLDVPPEQLESPYSLPLPPPGQPLLFNFRKAIPVSEGDRRRLLARLLRAEPPELGQICFTVVAEPDDDDDDNDWEQSVECCDVGSALVSLPDLLATGADLREETLQLRDHQERRVGQLVVSLTAVQALAAASRLR